MVSSLIANVMLLVAKIVAFILSQSKSVLASAADSFVDIASQVVIAVAEKYMRSADPRFPVGRTRLETVGVVACAIIMTIATIEVIQSAAQDLLAGFLHGQLPPLDMGWLMYAILGAATAVKVVLFIYCFALKNQSDSMLALAEDHSNDIVSNLGAIACGAIASISPKVWWVDSVGAILISLYIIWSWARILQGQVNKIVGLGAPVEFVTTLEELANAHDANMEVDVIRAYHFGARFIIEVIMPATMSVRESHDIALQLQHRVEGFDEVERAFVHVDYERRVEPEHKVDRNLQRNTMNLFEPHESCTLHGSGSGGALPSPRNNALEEKLSK
ncbi:cation efflux protein [Coccomyxa subellipsoidea C-169]|uniref:Cation efflux protein n=1 Tax=Coccomyxa subellipsoidea (strain C-169) TaxID=574566 RepID=I0Z9K8_COCSC|nr:cation efflux protein [Coccomyxa subellipsoidea C-169]EIE27327.1 cation efflux protein [Coccomyxa subellipsoidea C-169]|eukprot:XP_005651871.1 cation efflux protein [Coccomyxa subellipsoidea C-169]